MLSDNSIVHFTSMVLKNLILLNYSLHNISISSYIIYLTQNTRLKIRWQYENFFPAQY